MMMETSWADHLTIKRILGGKFLKMESLTDANGKLFQRTGFVRYDPETRKYSLFLLDSEGLLEELIGEEQASVLTFKSSGKTGDRLTLIFTDKGESRFRIATTKQTSDGTLSPPVDVIYTKDIVPSEPAKRRPSRHPPKRGGTSGIL